VKLFIENPLIVQILRKISGFFTFPIILLILGILAYGVQAFWLGYYLDDWVVLYHIYRGGYDQLVEYSFGVNRPYGAWSWWLGFSLLGYSPFTWHLWSMAWRVLTAVLLWLGWTQIFPERKVDISLASALFLVYPIFLQQTAAVTFSDHWMCFAFYALSIWFMVVAVRNPKRFVLFTSLALLASFIQLFTIEYFVGLELLRPMLLWFLIDNPLKITSRLKKVILHELPYAAVLAGFLTWRFMFMPTSGVDRNRPELLMSFIANPLKTISVFSFEVVQDLVEAVVGTWYKTYNPAAITQFSTFHLISWGVAGIVFLFTWVFFKNQSGGLAFAGDSGCQRSNKGWVAVTFFTMIAGFLPAWVIGQYLVSPANYSDRFGLAAMIGASLFLVGMIRLFLKPGFQMGLICLLISLGAGYQFRLANEYRWRWEQQSRIAWQLTWRVPGLQPGTLIYGDGVLASGSWVDIAWINFLLGSPASRNGEDYWYVDIYKLPVGGFLPAGSLFSDKRMENLSFNGKVDDSLVIQFKSVPNQCLWVVTPEDRGNPYLLPVIQDAPYVSNMERFDFSREGNPNVSAVFLPEPGDSWCYYFQKAHLAVQLQDWESVRVLWNELSAKNLKTRVAIEYLPFIRGIANTGNMELAMQISLQAVSMDHLVRSPICQTWKKITENSRLTIDRDLVIADIERSLDCEGILTR